MENTVDFFFFPQISVFHPKHDPSETERDAWGAKRHARPKSFTRIDPKKEERESRWYKRTRRLDEMRKELVSKEPKGSPESFANLYKNYLNELNSYKLYVDEENKDVEFEKLPLEWRRFTWKNTTLNSFDFETCAVAFNYASYLSVGFKLWAQDREGYAGFDTSKLAERIYSAFKIRGSSYHSKEEKIDEKSFYDKRETNQESKIVVSNQIENLKKACSVFEALHSGAEVGFPFSSGCWSEEFTSAGFFTKGHCRAMASWCFGCAAMLAHHAIANGLSFEKKTGAERDFKLSSFTLMHYEASFHSTKARFSGTTGFLNAAIANEDRLWMERLEFLRYLYYARCQYDKLRFLKELECNVGKLASTYSCIVLSKFASDKETSCFETLKDYESKIVREGIRAISTDHLSAVVIPEFLVDLEKNHGVKRMEGGEYAIKISPFSFYKTTCDGASRTKEISAPIDLKEIFAVVGATLVGIGNVEAVELTKKETSKTGEEAAEMAKIYLTSVKNKS